MLNYRFGSNPQKCNKTIVTFSLIKTVHLRQCLHPDLIFVTFCKPQQIYFVRLSISSPMMIIISFDYIQMGSVEVSGEGNHAAGPPNRQQPLTSNKETSSFGCIQCEKTKDLNNEEADCPHKPNQRQERPQQEKKEETKAVIEKENNQKNIQKQPKKLPASQNNTPTIDQAQQLKVSADKLKDQYKYELALEQYKKSMAIYQQINEKDSSKEVTNILINGIGDIYQRQGKYSLALEAYERGKTIYLEKEGQESYNYAKSLHKIGDVYDDKAEYDSALESYKKALIIWQKIKGKDSLQAGGTINNIGLVYWKKGDYPQALEYLKRSLQIDERAGQGNNIGAAMNYNNIGLVYDDQKEYTLALQYYEKALEIKQSIKGKNSVEAADTMMNIGLVYHKQGGSPSAVEIYKRAIAIYEKHQLRHRGYANAHSNLGNACQAMNDYGSAANAYRVSLSIFEQMALPADVKKSSLGLARCLNKMGEKGELERIIENYGVERGEI